MADPAITTSTSTPSALRAQLLDDCAAMAKYALWSGIEVPGNVLQPLEEAQILSSASYSVEEPAHPGGEPTSKDVPAGGRLTVRKLVDRFQNNIAMKRIVV